MDRKIDTQHRQIKLLIGLLLVLSILLAYGRIIHCDFVDFDDRLYVTHNRQVQKGLTVEGLKWALTTFHAANWHPVTWISHMLDCQIYGLNPTGHHWTNLQLHIANSLLLFFFLQQMTGALGRSAFVAALFALHPLHVESVAWVAERKDVLSTLFGLLTMVAYGRYVRRKGGFNYFLVFLSLGLGLMAKPMLVTLPFVLLLLDVWPLQRLRFAKNGGQPLEDRQGFGFQALWHLIYEKIPLFLLAGFSSTITFWAQRSGGALDPLSSLSLKIRTANAFVSYVSYILKAVWPTRLIVFYPHPGDTLPLWQGVGAAILICGVCYAVIRVIGSKPYLAVGWFWYLGTLVPVIGLLQAGEQAMADRYTYIPLTGLFIIIAWGVPDLLSKLDLSRRLPTVPAVVILFVLSALTFFQVGYWQNAVTLFEHALRSGPDNDLSHNNLGTALFYSARVDEAISHFKRAVELNPDFAQGLRNLGAALYEQGNHDEAVVYLKKALEQHPESIMARVHLGKVRMAQKNADQAAAHFKKAIDLDPKNIDARIYLADALTALGKFEEAKGQYTEVIRTEPDYADAHYNFGNLLIEQGRYKEAMTHFAEAIKIDPDHARAYHQIGVILARQGRHEEAGRFLTRALQIDPNYAQAGRNLKKITGYE
jgi:tetratricopeptide (TPR) repeat protein